MSKTKILFVVGIVIALLPYSGFPYLWKNVLSTVLGLLVAFLVYILNRESKQENTKTEENKTFENFSESEPPVTVTEEPKLE